MEGIFIFLGAALNLGIFPNAYLDTSCGHTSINSVRRSASVNTGIERRTEQAEVCEAYRDARLVMALCLNLKLHPFF
jgi:hypothetical protein